MKRYNVVKDTGKLSREVVLLNSVGGCSYGNCHFCDYQYEHSKTVLSALSVNNPVLDKITGETGVLEVINSASFSELPFDTIFRIKDISFEKNINLIITEQYFSFYKSNLSLSKFFSPIKMQFICGVETFDTSFREKVLNKGIGDTSAEKIAKYFQWVNLLFGIEGQTLDFLKKDIDIGLKYFSHINLCIFEENSKPLKRDNFLLENFYNSDFFLQLKNNKKIEIYDGGDKRAPDNLGGVGFENE